MARPQNKTDLLLQAESGYTKLMALVDSMTPDELNAPFEFPDMADKGAHWRRDKNLRDVLIHLYEWHKLLLSFVRANTAGAHNSLVPFLPETYTWNSYGQMNEGFVKKHQGTSLSQSESLLATSHSDVMALINSYSNEELFEKKHVPWTGTTSLGSYCVSATSSHYEWAIKKIRRHIRQIRAPQA